MYFKDFVKHIENLSLIEFGSDIFFNNGSNGQEVNASPQPSFNKQFNLLIQELNSNHSKGYKNYICCVTPNKLNVFDVFEDHDSVVHYKTIILSLHAGFVNHDLKIACYTDHQIFERYNKFSLKMDMPKQAISLKELNGLEIGLCNPH